MVMLMQGALVAVWLATARCFYIGVKGLLRSKGCFTQYTRTLTLIGALLAPITITVIVLYMTLVEIFSDKQVDKW